MMLFVSGSYFDIKAFSNSIQSPLGWCKNWFLMVSLGCKDESQKFWSAKFVICEKFWAEHCWFISIIVISVGYRICFQ